MKNAPLGLLAFFVACSTSSASLQSKLSAAALSGTTYYVSVAGDDKTGRPDDPAKSYRSPRGAYSAIPADITQLPGDQIIQLMDSTVYGQLAMTPKVTDETHRIILRAMDGTTPIMDSHPRT